MLKLVIQQKPGPARFLVKYQGLWSCFNTFGEVKDYLHSCELDQLRPYVDLTQDSLSDEIDQEYVRMTNHLRAV